MFRRLQHKVGCRAGRERHRLAWVGECSECGGVAVLQAHRRGEGVHMVRARRQAIQSEGPAGGGAKSYGEWFNRSFEVRNGVDRVETLLSEDQTCKGLWQGKSQICAVVAQSQLYR